jgi:Flp pilus assembly pilin Flp
MLTVRRGPRAATGFKRKFAMTSLIRPFTRNISGSIEYALIAAVRVLAVVGLAPLIGGGIAALLSIV